MPYSRMTFPPLSLSKGKVTPFWSAKTLLANGLSMLTPKTWVSAPSSSANLLLNVSHLLRSIGRENPDIESQSHILFLSVLTKRLRLSVLVHQREIRSEVADFDLRRRACLCPGHRCQQDHVSKSAILTLCIASPQAGKRIPCIFRDTKCGSSSPATNSDLHS